MPELFETLTTTRRRLWPIAALLFAAGGATRAHAESFDAFVSTLWPDAQAQGITRATFDAALAGVTPDMRVLGAMQHAPEYGKPFGAYIDSMVSASRLGAGSRKFVQWGDTVQAIEKRFGIPGAILIAIWGIESSYGDAQDHWDVFRCLVTLAQARFQQPYFRDELINAMKILQSRHIARRQFLGSFAGAMGQAQFMPSSYLNYAVDFDNDGRADIWASVPDVLASIANYLQKYGWQAGQSWGFEVAVPHGFDYRQSRGTFHDWSGRGLKRADGWNFPDAGEAILLFPSGATGPAFLVTQNFVVIKTYNNSDAYALAVAHLADRLRGFGPFRGPWPVNDFQPSRAERVALQYKLKELGDKVEDFAGHIDFALRDDIRKLQERYGMVPDGYPSRAFLERLGVRTP
jgi:membrane-bound lytic murein transglycosylase B